MTQKEKEYHALYYQRNKERLSLKHKEWRDNNKDKVKAYAINHRKTRRDYNKRKRQELKNIVYGHYGAVCSNPLCKDSRIEVLTLDHVNNDGFFLRKIHGTGLSLYSWIIKNNFPSYLQVLCWNCNLCKYHYGYLPAK